MHRGTLKQSQFSQGYAMLIFLPQFRTNVIVNLSESVIFFGAWRVVEFSRSQNAV